MTVTTRKRDVLVWPEGGVRQSITTGFGVCPRRTRFALQTQGDWATGNVETTADLGKMFHLVAGKILRTLYKTGEPNMSPEEGCEVMHEVCAEAPFWLPSEDLQELVWLVRGFCHFKWNASRILAMDQPKDRLSVELAGEDGVLRTLTGQPDVVISDPPEGGVIVDFKTGRGVPPSPRGQKDAEYAEGKQYLSDRGHAQLDTYGLLVLLNYPSMQYVTLRELHLRSGQTREATLNRGELQYVERRLGLTLQRLEEAIGEGPKSELWTPRPGKHCAAQCPVARSCPIPREQRGAGQISTEAQADLAANAWAVLEGQRNVIRKSLIAFHEATGYAPKVADGREVRYYQNGSGSRSFGLCDPDAPLHPKTVEKMLESGALSEPPAQHERG